LEVDLADAAIDCTDELSTTLGLEADNNNDGISCELGIRYQTLQAICQDARKTVETPLHTGLICYVHV
jgi:hypothetical protein